VDAPCDLDCSEHAIGRCVQCRRRFCSAHGRFVFTPDKTDGYGHPYSDYCLPCAEVEATKRDRQPPSPL
jgi:hypothetical protein